MLSSLGDHFVKQPDGRNGAERRYCPVGIPHYVWFETMNLRYAAVMKSLRRNRPAKP